MKPKLPPPGEPLPLDLCADYDHAAEWCARCNWCLGEPLPANLKAGKALPYIQANLKAFAKRVKSFRYEIDMNQCHVSLSEHMPWGSNPQ